MNTPPTQTLLLKPDHAPANGMGTANGTTALNGSARNGDHNAHFDFEMIYSSPAALDAYLGSIHQRREQRKQEREKRQHWHSAIDKLRRELALAQQDGDSEIADELQTVLHRFESLLGSYAPASPVAAPAVPVSPPVPAPSFVPPDAPTSAVAPPPIQSSMPTTALSQNPKAKSQNAEETPALSPQQRESARLARLEEIAELAQTWKNMAQEGLKRADGALDRPQCFRMRALVCDLGAAYARAYDDGLERAVQSDVDDLLDSIRATRRHAYDQYESLPFDPSCWSDPDDALSSDQWEYLATQYRQMAEAAAAWDWFQDNKNEITDDAKRGMLNAIAAAQQALYRTFQDWKGRDRLQEQYHGPIRDEAGPLGYLVGLNRQTSDAQIDALAQGLGQAWETAKQEADNRQERVEREARLTRQQAAIAAVAACCETVGTPETKTDPKPLRDRLFPLLDACLELGVPATNPQLREAMLHCGATLLRDQPAYARILESITDERERRGLDSSETDDAEWEAEEATELDENVAEDTLERYKEAVRPFVAGKRVVILGGSPRQRTCDELKAALDPLEVRWPESEKTDKLAKFETEIINSDVLLIAKNFARHYMSGRKVKDLVKENGGHFLMLPGGYGLNQIIYRLYQYVGPDEKR